MSSSFFSITASPLVPQRRQIGGIHFVHRCPFQDVQQREFRAELFGQRHCILQRFQRSFREIQRHQDVGQMDGRLICCGGLGNRSCRSDRFSSFGIHKHIGFGVGEMLGERTVTPPRSCIARPLGIGSPTRWPTLNDRPRRARISDRRMFDDVAWSQRTPSPPHGTTRALPIAGSFLAQSIPSCTMARQVTRWKNRPVPTRSSHVGHRPFPRRLCRERHRSLAP